MTDCRCDPPADKITLGMPGSRVVLRVGAEVGSDILAAKLGKAQQQLADITGMPTLVTYHDRKCEHRRDYTEVIVSPDRSAQSAGEVT